MKTDLENGRKDKKRECKNSQVAFKVWILKPIDLWRWRLPVYSLHSALWCLSLRRVSAWDLCECVCVQHMCVLLCREQVNWLVAHVHRRYLSLWSLFFSERARCALKMNHKLTLALSAAATRQPTTFICFHSLPFFPLILSSLMP